MAKSKAKPVTTRAPREARTLARTEPQSLEERPPRAEIRRFLDALVDEVNETLAKSQLAHESVANTLLRRVFDNDADLALGPNRHRCWRYVDLRERAGKSLDLDSESLSDHVRIGALNEKLKSEAWVGLRWSKKVALLPLLSLEKPLPAIRRGVSFALRPSVGVRSLREWVKAQGGASDENALALRRGSRVITGTVNLSDPEQRKAVAKAARAAPAQRREKFVSDLRDGIAGLQALLAEIES